MTVVGIDLGGTHMQVGVVDDEHRIVHAHRARTHASEGPHAVIDRIVAGVLQACAGAALPIEGVDAVGIAAPGAFDMPRGVILEAPNLGWYDMPLRDVLTERIGRPVVVENDVNGALWGEYRLGAGRGHGDQLGVWVGTGVGGGLVIDGRLFHGTRHTASEIGQTLLHPDAPERYRTVEDLCSRTGFSRLVVDRLPMHPRSPLAEVVSEHDGVVPSNALAEAVADGDELATQIMHETAAGLGTAIANMVTMLALDLVIVGGGVTEALGEPFLELIRERFRRDVFPRQHESVELRMTELRDDAGLLGAAMLALDRTS